MVIFKLIIQIILQVFFDSHNYCIGNIYVINNSKYELLTDNEWIESVNETTEVIRSSHTTLVGENVLAINYTDPYDNYTVYIFDKGDRTVNVIVNWGSGYAQNWINSLKFKF